MATRVVRLYGGEKIVNSFDFDSEAMAGLSVREFDKPTTEWARFVMNNRDRAFSDIDSPECNFDSKYDIVIGPVANDDMALMFRQYAENLITLDALAEGLEFRDLTNQYSFHTEKAITALTFRGVLDE
jgi:hypothetical protein